jgi:hypothetical protein
MTSGYTLMGEPSSPKELMRDAQNRHGSARSAEDRC